MEEYETPRLYWNSRMCSGPEHRGPVHIAKGVSEMSKEKISPLGFKNARELTVEEIDSVGGGATHTARAKGTYNGGVDGEIEYDIEW